MIIEEKSAQVDVVSRHKNLFKALALAYVLLCVLLTVLIKQKWFTAGIIIGALYVLVSMFYFYDEHFLPYLSEKKASRKDENSKIDPLHSTDEADKRRQHIVLWMLRWIIPTVSIQFFIIMGFWITIEKSSLSQNIFIHPFLYGKIYKQVESYDSQAESFSPGVDDAETSKYEKAIKDKKNFYETKLHKYFEFKTKASVDDETEISSIDFAVYKIPFLIAVAFSFLGTILYTLRDTAYRYFTKDLYPKTFIEYLIRFVFAPALCITIAYFLMNNWPLNGAPILFLLVGFFPQRAMKYIEEKAMRFFNIKREERKEISLNTIQGMTDYMVYRFKEIGIGDVQNLAYVKLSELEKNIGYSRRMLYDFVDQALLMIHLEKDFPELQMCGIRGIIEFRKVMKDGNHDKYSKLLNISKDKLKGVVDLIESTAMKKRIMSITTRMEEFEKQEQAVTKKN